jgi:predicted nucleic acid-binding protein
MTDAIVVDNSALIELVVTGMGSPGGRRADRGLVKRLTLSTGYAPEVIDAEALTVLRKFLARKEISDDHASTVMRRVMDAPIARISHRPLLADAWRMRHSVGGADALYLALAERLDAPLITCDKRLANSNGHEARIEWYPLST